MSWDTPNYAVPGLMPVTSPKQEAAMPLLPIVIFLEPHVMGDDWAGIPTIGPVLFNDAPPSTTLAVARIIFFRNNLSEHELIIDTSSPYFTIVDDATWEMTIGVVPGVEFTLTEGQWEWIIDVEDADGIKQTLYRGTIEVTEARP